MGIHLLCCAHGNERALEPMMQFSTPLPPLHEMLVSTWDKNSYMRFFQPHSIPLVNESTFLFTNHGIRTLADIVITNPMRVDLLP
jgi:hypothetical protein